MRYLDGSCGILRPPVVNGTQQPAKRGIVLKALIEVVNQPSIPFTRAQYAKLPKTLKTLPHFSAIMFRQNAA
jgi:hypothetical protein